MVTDWGTDVLRERQTGNGWIWRQISLNAADSITVLFTLEGSVCLHAPRAAAARRPVAHAVELQVRSEVEGREADAARRGAQGDDGAVGDVD